MLRVCRFGEEKAVAQEAWPVVSHTEDPIKGSKDGTPAIRKCLRYARMIFLTLHDWLPSWKAYESLLGFPPNIGIKLCHIDFPLIGVIHGSWKLSNFFVLKSRNNIPGRRKYTPWNKHSPLKIGRPKMDVHFPTIDFQGRTVSFRSMEWMFSLKSSGPARFEHCMTHVILTKLRRQLLEKLVP